MILISKSNDGSALDRKNIRKSICFLLITVESKDTESVAAKAKDDFKRYTEETPKEHFEFRDQRNGELLFFDNGQLKTINKPHQILDFDCLVAAISIYILKYGVDTSRKGWKMHYSYIYKLICEGLFGTTHGMTVEDFIDKMKENNIDVGKASNIYDHIPNNEYPNWSSANWKRGNDKDKAMSFAKEILLLYGEAREQKQANHLEDSGKDSGKTE